MQASLVWNVPATLLQLEREGDADLLRDVISLFREDTLARLQQLRDAVGQGDAAGLRRQAHIIKGSATQLGADLMAALCQELEQRSLRGETSALPAMLEKLRTEFDRIWPAMADRMARPE